MFRTVFILVVAMVFKSASGQFYFQDIVNAKQSSLNYSLLKAKNVKKVTVSSVEPDGSETEGFGIEQTVMSSSNQLKTVTASGITGTSVMTTTFNSTNYPIAVTDSSANTVTNVNYTYNASGKLSVVSSSSHEPDDTNHYTIREDHLYYYDVNGNLSKMLKIKDKYDTTYVTFVATENGLPGEEQWMRKGRKLETWYYYYDDANRLTDIVRYNATAKKMLPDYIFQYEDDGQLAQQTVVQAGTNFYRLWLYEYNDNSLKKAETIFNKGKEQEGRILYEYQ